MCEGVGLGLGFKRESVRARYMGHVEMTSFGGECLFVS